MAMVVADAAAVVVVWSFAIIAPEVQRS